MMDHRHYIEQYLSADVDGALSPTERQAVAAHLAACADCRLRQADERALKALLRERIPIVSAPAELRQQIIAALDREDARSNVRRLRFSGQPLNPRPVWLALAGGLASAAAIFVILLVRGPGQPPPNRAFEAAVNEYLTSERSFASSSALSSPADLALALSTELGYPFVWDFSSVGLTLTGARIEHRPDGRALIYSLYKGKSGSLLCINFRQPDLALPPGGQDLHGVRFYKYKNLWIGVVNYGQVFCYFVTRLTPTQLMPALLHNGPNLGTS
jgi:anti-sigma factor RsiW